MRVRSLRVRLLLMFMLVAVIALGAVTVFASQATGGAFQNYINRQQDSDQQLISQILTTYGQDPQKVQVLVEQTAQTDKTRILVIDHSQHVVADSNRQLTGQVLTLSTLIGLESMQHVAPGGASGAATMPPRPRPIRIISTDNSGISFGPAPLSMGRGSPEEHFLDSVNHSLLLAVIVAGLVALLLTLVLSNTILKPIRALTLAASRMEQGDLSQRVKIKTKDEIGGLAHAFNTMAESLDRSEQLRRNLISDVAHELRTPLTNIRGYLEALQDEVVEPDPAVLALLYEEAMLLSRLVTDLQDLTLAEAGQLRLQLAPIALEDIINTVVSGLALQARSKNLSLQVDVPADLPLVEADPQRVGQILRNLLSNAIKHTPPDGEICVSAQVAEQEVEVRVKDTGMGIAAEHLPYLFKRFYRADPSRARATGGTGLGLAIVEQLVHAHGGRVDVESQVGQGTCFTFTLPVALM
ncbi:MAG: HAMP domain-containing protein [Chloroflexi bacterium]|nr:HAMP domain-containing protein [Chloroflexota bacterium]